MSTHTFFSLCVPSPVATVQETKWDAEREKACINTYAHASASQICLQNLCGQQQNSPMADPTFGLIAHRRVRFFTFMCVSTLVLSRSLYRSHVLTTFLGLVLGAMMKQVCWHSPCHCFLMLALLRPSRRTRQNRSRQQSAASGC